MNRIIIFILRFRLYDQWWLDGLLIGIGFVISEPFCIIKKPIQINELAFFLVNKIYVSQNFRNNMFSELPKSENQINGKIFGGKNHTCFQLLLSRRWYFLNLQYLDNWCILQNASIPSITCAVHRLLQMRWSFPFRFFQW